MAISLAAHPLPGSVCLQVREGGYFEAVLAQNLLIIVRTVLAAAIRVGEALYQLFKRDQKSCVV